MVIVFEAQEAVTPEGRPVAVPMPVAPGVVWVIGVRAVLRHTVGVAEGGEAVFARIRQPQAGAEGVPRFTSMQFSVVLNTSSPLAGVAMALRCAVLIRGGSIPRVVLCTSSSAEGLGVVLPRVVCAANGAAAKAKSRGRVSGMSVCEKEVFI